MNDSEVRDLKVDRGHLSVASLSDESDEKAYWLGRSPQQRLEGLELLRRIFYGDAAATDRLQRLLEIAELPWG